MFAVFTASYMVLTFQVPMLMFLGPRRVNSLTVSFCLWLSPHGVPSLPFGEPSLLELEKSWWNLVCVSVELVCLHGRVAYPAQNPLEPEDRCFLLGFFLNLLIWVFPVDFYIGRYFELNISSSKSMSAQYNKIIFYVNKEILLNSLEKTDIFYKDIYLT